MERLRMRQEAINTLEKLGEYYGLDNPIPDRIIQKVDVALGEEDEALRRQLLSKAYKSMELHALAEWANKKASGPNNPENLELRAKKAMSIVKLLRSQGKEEQAKKQIEKADGFRKQAEILRQKNGNGNGRK